MKPNNEPRTAGQEALALNKLMPSTYYASVSYPVTYAGKQIKIARTHGIGHNSGKSYLHVWRPCTLLLKTPAGEIIDRRPSTSHYRIELYNPDAAWKDIS